jgi:CheY-like chemotaxis protein
MFLFVEDNGADIAMAASSLSRLGARNSRVVDTAGKAMDFLRRVESGEQAAPEAVIVDLILRDSAGQDVIGSMRGRQALKQIPVLVWTVVEDEIQHKICLALGAREVLVKSRRAQELQEAVLRLRATRSSSAEDD